SGPPSRRLTCSGISPATDGTRCSSIRRTSPRWSGSRWTPATSKALCGEPLDCVGILETVPRDDADDAAARARGRDGGDPGRRGGLAEEALLARDTSPGLFELPLRERNDESARPLQNVAHAFTMHGLGDSDRGGERVAAARGLAEHEAGKM